MGKNEYDIKDTEFRIIGQSSMPAEPQQKPRKTWLWILLAVVAAAGGGFAIYWFLFRKKENDKNAK